MRTLTITVLTAVVSSFGCKHTEQASEQKDFLKSHSDAESLRRFPTELGEHGTIAVSIKSFYPGSISDSFSSPEFRFYLYMADGIGSAAAAGYFDAPEWRISGVYELGKTKPIPARRFEQIHDPNVQWTFTGAALRDIQRKIYRPKADDSWAPGPFLVLAVDEVDVFANGPVFFAAYDLRDLVLGKEASNTIKLRERGSNGELRYHVELVETSSKDTASKASMRGVIQVTHKP